MECKFRPFGHGLLSPEVSLASIPAQVPFRVTSPSAYKETLQERLSYSCLPLLPSHSLQRHQLLCEANLAFVRPPSEVPSIDIFRSRTPKSSPSTQLFAFAQRPPFHPPLLLAAKQSTKGHVNHRRTQSQPV